VGTLLLLEVPAAAFSTVTASLLAASLLVAVAAAALVPAAVPEAVVVRPVELEVPVLEPVLELLPVELLEPVEPVTVPLPALELSPESLSLAGRAATFTVYTSLTTSL
jgi:hypothetical protein